MIVTPLKLEDSMINVVPETQLMCFRSGEVAKTQEMLANFMIPVDELLN